MSRIRTIKPEFWTSEQILFCSRDARLLFIGLWNFSDDAGIHPASLMRLKTEVLPGDSCNLEEIKSWVDELIKHDLIIEYCIENKKYWRVTGWELHQKIDQPTFKFPWEHGKIPCSPNKRRTFTVCSPPEGKGREWKGMDVKAVLKNTELLVHGEQNAEDADEKIGQEIIIPKTLMPPCPHADIVKLYHQILPSLRQMREWHETRQKYLQRRWRDDPARQNLNFWRKLFVYVSKSNFLMGQVNGRDGKPPFCADLEWIVKPTNFAKIIEGKYHKIKNT